MNTYIVETSHGANAGTADAAWSAAEHRSSIEQAREAMAEMIGARIDCEDRGEEFESEWQRLADRAKTAEVGDVLEFDERAWRIVNG